jgi:hypothetical protein
MSQILGLGASKWKRLTVRRGSNKLVADDIAFEMQGASLAVTAPSGRAKMSGRSFEFSGLNLNVLTPATIPAPHVQFASNVRSLAKKGKLTLSAVSSAAADAGVTVANTAEAIRNARFTLSLDSVTEGGKEVVANFETSGTLEELLAALKGEDVKKDRKDRADDEDDDVDEDDDDVDEDDDEEQAATGDRIIEVTSATGNQIDYSFRVTGTLEQADPEPDTGRAVDEITEVDGGFRVDGTVGSGVDRFRVSGELIEINVPENVNIETVREL